MTDKERALRILTIQPTDLSRWMKLCRRLVNEVRIAHPAYPPLTETQLMSYVKRLVPEIRSMIDADDKPV